MLVGMAVEVEFFHYIFFFTVQQMAAEHLTKWRLTWKWG